MLEAFSKLGSDDVTICRSAGADIFAHVGTNASELEYSVTRLVRGLESSKVSTRTGSYSTLVAFLGLKHLKVSQLREIVAKTLLTDQNTSKKERRCIYIARILACGAILRTVPFAQLVSDEKLFVNVIGDLVELGRKRATLLELATPFICQVLRDKNMTKEIFEDVVWPILLPLFAKLEVKPEKKIDNEDDDNVEEVDVKVDSEGKDKDARAAVLLIALTCSEKELKTDFDFLNDMDRVVRILLAYRIANVSQIVDLVVKYVKKQGLSEEFWNSLVLQMRSSHFETICFCVQKSVEAGIHQSLIVRKELVTPLLGVFRNDEAAEQHAQAVKTLSTLLKWSNKEDDKMGKKDRKSVIKALFGGSPNLLHEYQKLLRIITPFLGEVCTEKDLTVLESVVRKHLDSETSLNIRMCIVYIQFLSRIAQSKKSSPELKLTIGKRILSIAFGKETLNLTKSTAHSHNTDDEEGAKKQDTPPSDDKEAIQQVSKACMESFKSLIGSTYSPQFVDEIIYLVNEDLDSFCKEKATKKLFKKAEKQKNKTTDVHLKYILGSYAMRLILEQDKVLGEAQTYLEELLEIAKSSSDDATPGIVQFLLSTVSKDEQPPFDYEALFSRFVIEDKVSEDIIQQFADMVDVEIGEGFEGGEESDSSDDDADEEEQDAEKMDIEEDEEVSDVEEEEKSPKNAKSKSNKGKSKEKENMKDGDDEEDDSDSGSISSVDMDDATEEDLAFMDKALAKVFATKKKVKEEETSEIRSLMRTFRLLETLLNRNSKVCPVSIPIMLLMPIVHALQHASRGKKSNNSLSTRIVSVLNKLNAIKKIEGGDSIEKGTLLNMSKDLVSLTKQGKNRLIGDLLGDSIVMLTKCYLQGSQRSKGEDTGFVVLYTGLLDLKDDTRNKSMGISSNLISSALTTLPNWDDGKDAIVKKILSIIFNPSIRHFRRMQFLILLRAALSDKSNVPELSKWKMPAMKALIQHAAKYLPTADSRTNNIVKELLLTLTDATNADPSLLDVVGKFFKKLYKDHSPTDMKVVTDLVKNQPQVKKLFIQIDLFNHIVEKIVPSKIIPNGDSVLVTPKNKNKPVVAVASKRKSERIMANKTPASSTTTTPSKKKRLNQSQ